MVSVDWAKYMQTNGNVNRNLQDNDTKHISKNYTNVALKWTMLVHKLWNLPWRLAKKKKKKNVA